MSRQSGSVRCEMSDVWESLISQTSDTDLTSHTSFGSVRSLVESLSCNGGSVGITSHTDKSKICNRGGVRSNVRCQGIFEMLSKRIWINGKLSAFQAEYEGSIPSIR